MTWYRLLVFACLGGWLVLSILTVARSSWVSGRRRWDVFRMLSGWRLFLTAEGAHPRALPILYRDRRRDGSLGSLTPVVSGTIDWTPRVMFWHAEWDLEVLLRRLVKDLQKDIQAQAGQPVPTLHSYRHLAHIVDRRARSSDAVARQFVVLATRGRLSGRPLTRVFQSDFYSL